MTPADCLVLIIGKLTGRVGRTVLNAPTVMAFCQVESSFNERAFLNDRNGGSYGLMQLDVPTARDRGYQGTPEGLYDPSTNIEFGMRQLDWIATYLKNHDAFTSEAMYAAYNEGVGNAIKGARDPVYVNKILTALATWQSAGT